MKRYEVRGMMEWHPVFRVGRGRLKVAFTGGHLSAGGCTPASFETGDPVVQKVIESSAAYREGLITGRECGPSEGTRPATASDAALAPEGARQSGPCGAAVRLASAWAEPMAALDERVEFQTLGEAQDFLQRSKGLAIDRILDEKACIAMAAQLGMQLIIKESMSA